MKKTKRNCYLLLTFIALIACEEPPKQTIETETSENLVTSSDANCVAPPTWFTGSVPEPQPQNFPQGDTLTNCDFHLVSWQYFLWLTEEVEGKLRFETFYTDKAIHPDTKDDTYQILDIVEQALSKGILVDQGGRAVYGNIMINDVYRDWILDNKLYDPNVFIDFDDTADFPVGSMSLKATWKIVQPDEDVSKFYTKKADIKLMKLVDGEPRIPDEDVQIQKNVEVALVAFHIAVVVEGHPEFIWATFEFDENAPNFKANQGMNEAVSDQDWLFYKANTVARKTNSNNTGVLSFLDESKQTLRPVTEVGRQYAQGGGSPTNQENIKNLNTSVSNQLSSGSNWKNFMEVGAIWFNTEKGVLKPNWNPNVDASMLTGSLLLSNSTIETFTQKVRSQNQCFSCHNTSPVTNAIPVLSGKNANTSHILLKNYQGGGEVKR